MTCPLQHYDDKATIMASFPQTGLALSLIFATFDTCPDSCQEKFAWLSAFCGRKEFNFSLYIHTVRQGKGNVLAFYT